MTIVCALIAHFHVNNNFVHQLPRAFASTLLNLFALGYNTQVGRILSWNSANAVPTLFTFKKFNFVSLN